MSEKRSVGRVAAATAEDLIRDLNVRSRVNQTVHTIKTNDGTGSLAEVVVGKTRVRLNLRDPLPSNAPRDGLYFGGFSSMWVGGGTEITRQNASAARGLLMWLVEQDRRKDEGKSGDGDGDGQVQTIDLDGGMTLQTLTEIRDEYAEGLEKLNELIERSRVGSGSDKAVELR